MTVEASVSVVIPTVGRPSLRRAVESALSQTARPKEVIVVLDTDEEPDLPESHSVSVVRTSGGAGPSVARQLGFDSSTGDVIALLDDDDLWRADKLEKQLAAVPHADEWIISCRIVVQGEVRAPFTAPRRLIRPTESLIDYLVTFRSFRFGGACLQTSTLMFPRSIAKAVPLSASAGAVHDDPFWLIMVRREFPGLPIVQLPDPLVEYHVSHESVSRSTQDRSEEYIDWGLRELAGESRRIRGDYQLTNPVTAAVSAASMRGVMRSIAAGVRSGRPGPMAWAYALTALARIGLQRAKTAARRPARNGRR
jgi:glycosyltransferase involved in cell wall biosynthesis